MQAKISNMCTFIIESNSPLLNAFEKLFSKEIIYNSDSTFDLTNENATTIFDVLNKSIFNNKLKHVDIFCGSANELEKIIAEKFKVYNIKISDYLAMYLPKLEIKQNIVKQTIHANKLYEAIFINTENSSKTTFAYAVATICHEMIHCLDANNGTLLRLTETMLQHKKSAYDINVASHYTPLFISKATNMKKQHGITILMDGNNEPLEVLSRKAAEEIKTLEDSDNELNYRRLTFSEEFKQQHKDDNVIFFSDDGTYTLVIGD